MKIVLPLILVIFCITDSNAQHDTLLLKKRVAIMNIKDNSGWKGGNAGSAISNMLITELVKTDKFQVVEQDALQELNNNENISPAKLNQLGVQMLITGGVTEYGMKNETKSEHYVYFAQKTNKQMARVAVDLRLINTATGEIIFAEKAIGEESSESKGIALGAIGKGNYGTDNTLLDIAKREAIEKCIGLISKATTKIPWGGSIIKVNEDGTLFMKPGSAGGVKPDMKFAVYSKGEELIDPETGLTLGSSEKYLGIVRVLEDVGGGKACKVSILSGEGYKAGDIVRVN